MSMMVESKFTICCLKFIIQILFIFKNFGVARFQNVLFVKR
jgi:hypothetical protein